MHPIRYRAALTTALDVRHTLHNRSDLSAYRLIDGLGDDMPGLTLDRYGPAVVLNVYEDAGLREDAVTALATLTLDMLSPDGVESVYVKRFVRDRSRLGGQAPDETRVATPRAGRPQPEAVTVREYEAQFEVRLYDGFSTGLFLEHRDHRRVLAQLQPARALNLFAYTCAFAVPLVAAGASVANVDVSSRYLEWGKRNLALNGLPADRARYHRMDALEFLAWAAKRADERFDLVILDPPTFASGDARRGRKPWKATTDYPALLQAAARVVAPGGRIFAASNTRELAEDGVLKQLVIDALADRGVRRAPRWETLPPWPVDVREPARVAAVLFGLR